MSRLRTGFYVLFCAAALCSQDVQGLLQGLKSAAQQSGIGGNLAGGDAIPSRTGSGLLGQMQGAQQSSAEDLQLDLEIRQLKAREKGPKRFAADLFEVRQKGSSATDGGISDEYVLGTGDQLDINAYGSAAFEVPVQVDGRGLVVIPKLGAVKVGGMPLGRARDAIQSRVRRQFSNTSVDVQATQLREVRVLVMGEVYKPGSYLVSSLSSLINVLSLAGGPNAAGSYRQIKVLRGGKVVHLLDLYPFRADGLGNTNFYLENGDTVFVPLALNLVTLEGAFTRVVASATQDIEAANLLAKDDHPNAGRQERILRRQIAAIQSQLNNPPGPSPQVDAGGNPFSSFNSTTQPQPGAVSGASRALNTSSLVQNAQGASAGNGALAAGNALPGSNALLGSSILFGANTPLAPPSVFSPDQLALQQQLEDLQQGLKDIQAEARLDQRIDNPDASIDENQGKPEWLKRWQVDGVAPQMQFELLPGETAADALRFAGGFDIGGLAGRLTIRRMDGSGAWTATDVVLGGGAASPEMRRGDLLSALPLRDHMSRQVHVAGWVRGPGDFSRTDGLKVGDLLKEGNQVLPDTYLGRGEITRRLSDGTTRFLAFDLSKALSGDPQHNLQLEDRDRIDLYRIGDLRIRKLLTVVGPVDRPGTYEFLEGMRASDLLFRAGIPLLSADRLVAELAHVRENRKSDVKRLDLTRLLSSESSSPVDLKDDAVNPLLEPFDQLSVYAQPNFRSMRSITLSGEVTRPGVYALTTAQTTLKEVVERAGGLTSQAMPQAAIFLRSMWQVDPDKAKASKLTGVQVSDPTSNGITETLNRLNETMRNPLTGALLANPLLHGLQSGALSRLVVDVPTLLAGGKERDLELQDGDEVVFPAKTVTAYVIGETASPFAAYKVDSGMNVDDLIKRAGGVTRNADRGGIRLLKANGQIVDSWVSRRKVEPGDAILVPQRIRKDLSWQENLQALTPLAIMVNALKK